MPAGDLWVECAVLRNPLGIVLHALLPVQSFLIQVLMVVQLVLLHRNVTVNSQPKVRFLALCGVESRPEADLDSCDSKTVGWI